MTALSCLKKGGHSYCHGQQNQMSKPALWHWLVGYALPRSEMDRKPIIILN